MRTHARKRNTTSDVPKQNTKQFQMMRGIAMYKLRVAAFATLVACFLSVGSSGTALAAATISVRFHCHQDGAIYTNCPHPGGICWHSATTALQSPDLVHPWGTMDASIINSTHVRFVLHFDPDLASIPDTLLPVDTMSTLHPDVAMALGYSSLVLVTGRYRVSPSTQSPFGEVIIPAVLSGPLQTQLFGDKDWMAAGSQEVPSNVSSATGFGVIEVDTLNNKLHFDITENVSGETAAHIHGPAARGVNAGVLFALPSGAHKAGYWDYPQSLEADILAGRTYMNFHSAGFPGGEIRGQIEPDVAQQRVPSMAVWGTVALALSLFGVGGLYTFRRRRAEV